MTHALKTWPDFYHRIEDGSKPFEVRKLDRPFKEGDTVLLQEFDPGDNTYTGKECSFKITYLLEGPAFGIKKGYCVFGLGHINSYD